MNIANLSVAIGDPGIRVTNLLSVKTLLVNMYHGTMVFWLDECTGRVINYTKLNILEIERKQ